jgi:hypothetical protein
VEAILLDCGAGGPQLKRNPLDGAMIDTDDLKDAILQMAEEDWYGLYEVIWRLNNQQPNVPQQLKIEAARRVIQSLLEEHELSLGWLEWPLAGPPMVMPVSEATQLLTDPRSWQPSRRCPVLVSHSPPHRAV